MKSQPFSGSCERSGGARGLQHLEQQDQSGTANTETTALYNSKATGKKGTRAREQSHSRVEQKAETGEEGSV